MTVSPFDHPFLSGLLGDEEARGIFPAEAEIAAMLAFERALAEAEATTASSRKDAAAAIVAALSLVQAGSSRRCEPARQDGVVVPELVRQLRGSGRRAA